MLIEEKRLKQLNKGELLHLLTDVVGIPDLSDAWARTRNFHADKELKCWDCESIERKLDPYK